MGIASTRLGAAMMAKVLNIRRCEKAGPQLLLFDCVH
jgi:hypothetical protein